MVKVRINGEIKEINDHISTRKINATDTMVKLRDGSEVLLVTEQMIADEQKKQSSLIPKEEFDPEPLQKWLRELSAVEDDNLTMFRELKKTY